MTVPPDDAEEGSVGRAAGIGHQWASLLTSVAAHRPPVGRDGVGLGDTSSGAGDGGHSSAQPTPVTLLTGFLGAGKSTILAQLLTEPGRSGVVRAVVNDVGQLPFDPTLVDVRDRAMVQLTNGCGCCVAGAAADLAATLDQVGPGADLVVLEASGLADPAALAQVVEARPGLRLDRTVAVVDARAVDEQLELAPVAPILRRQLDTAEAVILSHVDDLGPEELAELAGRVGALAPGSPVVASTLAEPAAHVLANDFLVGATLPLGQNDAPAGLMTHWFEANVPVGAVELRSALTVDRLGLLRAKGRVLVDGRPTLVQFSRSGLSLTGDRLGPLGLTVVTSDDAAVGGLIALLGPPSDHVAEAAPGPRPGAG